MVGLLTDSPDSRGNLRLYSWSMVLRNASSYCLAASVVLEWRMGCAHVPLSDFSACQRLVVVMPLFKRVLLRWRTKIEI